MRLINVKTLQLEEFLDYRAPPYAILSHTWGEDCEELSFRDVEDGNIDKPGVGSVKFRGCCRQAEKDGLRYAWIDTCCIDKANLVELSEAINSMFRWYQRAAICYAYLSDVPSDDNPRKQDSKFQTSRWFQRGWTLQELLAPKTLRFYSVASGAHPTTGAGVSSTLHDSQSSQDARSEQRFGQNHGNRQQPTAVRFDNYVGYDVDEHGRLTSRVKQYQAPVSSKGTIAANDVATADLSVAQQWHYVGTKGSMSTIIAKITGIPRQFLLGIAELHTASVAQRMSWAAQRHTKRKEDLAYCLLGIFDVTMPMIYGEGGEKAFFRLQEQIMKITRDDSILAWGLGNNGPSANNTSQAVAGRILAMAPENFANSGHIVRREQSLTFTSSIDMSGGSLRAYLPLVTTSTGNLIGLLSCGPEDNASQVVGIPLIKLGTGSSDEYARPRECFSALQWTMTSEVRPKSIHIKHGSQETVTADSSQLYYHYEDDDFAELDLNIIDVYPRTCWDKERSLITTVDGEIAGALGQILVRLRQEGGESHDFVIAIGFKEQSLEIGTDWCVFICNRDTLLRDLATHLPLMMEKLEGKIRAWNGTFCLRVTLERLERQPIFFIRPEPTLAETFTTVNATEELEENILILESLRLLSENKLAKREEEKLEETVKHQKERLEEIKSERNSILLRISELEEEERRLRKQEQENTKALSTSTMQQAEMQEKRNDASRQWFYTQGQLKKFRRVVDSTCDYDNFDMGSFTPLQWAAISGYAKVAQQLIDKGADVDAMDAEGATALIMAASNGHVASVQLLLDRGADIEVGGKRGVTALFAATMEGHTGAARLLLDRGANIEVKAQDDITPLMIAASKGDVELVQLLLDHGADIEAKSKEAGFTPLMVAALYRYNVGPVQLLLAKGADLEARDNTDRTALIYASNDGVVESIRVLLDQGADIEAKDKDGMTALMCAISAGKTEAVWLLLNKGANMEAKSRKGETPLMVASSKGHNDLVQLLLDRGADVDTTGENGMTLLMAASVNGKFETVQLLLATGKYSLDAEDNGYGRTALEWAVHCGHEDIVELIHNTRERDEMSDFDDRLSACAVADLKVV
ncbi:het domain [Trichoderma arundinaceum]|uniref:Het domain n=1 Tax=Trichoderma arundinaceum TaxID=490622 RepID=A0A395NH07_TRIAR|nr:het domain [Trichoderma arundinaceum]